jgi:ActR/RegA family two-component response regulator
MAVALIRALMDRHRLPRYRQSAWLADALGLSYAQAHRRMNGASPWSLEDLAKVAALFGESLSDLFSAGQPEASVPAVMSVGGARLPCQLWLGEQVEQPRPDSLVAVKTSAGWSAVLASEPTDGVAYRIERLEAKPAAKSRRIIAVLDDDQDLTNSIVAHLEDSGYDARPFYQTAELMASATGQRFDAYVLDWIVGDRNVLKLIASLRERDAKCPIIVLTAQVLAGVVNEQDIADAVKRFDLVFSEKPVRTSILAATLTRAFAATGP